MALPPPLRPSTGLLSALFHRSSPASDLLATAAIPAEQLHACRQAVAEAARPYGMIDTAIYSYGRPAELPEGGRQAPVYARIVYQRASGYETRQAPIWCVFDEAGNVSRLLEIPA